MNLEYWRTIETKQSKFDFSFVTAEGQVAYPAKEHAHVSAIHVDR